MQAQVATPHGLEEYIFKKHTRGVLKIKMQTTATLYVYVKHGAVWGILALRNKFYIQHDHAN